MPKKSIERIPVHAIFALITNGMNMKEAHFWENAMVNRGVTAKVFDNRLDAQQWLYEKIEI